MISVTNVNRGTSKLLSTISEQVFHTLLFINFATCVITNDKICLLHISNCLVLHCLKILDPYWYDTDMFTNGQSMKQKQISVKKKQKNKITLRYIDSTRIFSQFEAKETRIAQRAQTFKGMFNIAVQIRIKNWEKCPISQLNKSFTNKWNLDLHPRFDLHESPIAFFLSPELTPLAEAIVWKCITQLWLLPNEIWFIKLFTMFAHMLNRWVILPNYCYLNSSLFNNKTHPAEISVFEHIRNVFTSSF